MQIVNGDLSEHALWIDQITRAKREPFVLDQTWAPVQHAYSSLQEVGFKDLVRVLPSYRGCSAYT